MDSMRRKLISMLTPRERSISGNAPLSFRAKAGNIKSLKQYGKCVQDGTPTPDAPVDIVCNNGVLKARHQSGLPLGYTLLDYITFTGTQYIDTGLNINNNTRVLIDTKKSTSSEQSIYLWVGGARDYVGDTNINKKTLEFSKEDSTEMYLQYATSAEVAITVPNTTNRHTYDFNKNELYIDENLIYTATQETFTGNATFLIGTIHSRGSISKVNNFYGDIYGFKLWQDGTNLSMDLIPAKRNSDNVLGMYDTVSGQFFTNQGTGDFTAGDTVSDPVEVYADGTVETIEDTIGNTATAEMLLKVGDYQDVQEILAGAITRNVGLNVLDGTETWTASGNLFYAGIATDALENTHSCYCTHFKGVATNASVSYNNEIKVGTNATQTVNWTRVQIYPVFGTYSNVTAFKQYLADQYNAGTPVIVVYPLAEPTTESVTPQSLRTRSGNNTIEVDSNVDPVEIEVKYRN